jgi:hypothetical protein
VTNPAAEVTDPEGGSRLGEGGSRPGNGGGQIGNGGDQRDEGSDRLGNGPDRLGNGPDRLGDGQADARRAHTARLDHVYTRGFPHATLRVLEDSTMDHRPVVTTIASGGAKKSLTKLNRRPFKAIRREALEAALSQKNWSEIYSIKDVEEVHKFIVDGIHSARDAVAPVKEITVKIGSNLYLTRETLEIMERRDSARAGTPRYRALRNAANQLVKCDKLASNAETLAKSSSDPRVLWQLANDALGKAPTALQPALVNAAGNMTTGKREAANAMNTFFISKVDSLRAAGESPASDAVNSATDARNPTAGQADVATPVPN